MSAKPTVIRRAKTKDTLQQPKTKEEWLEQKLKNPYKYGMTPQGDLGSHDGGITLELIPQVPASVEYIKEQFAKKDAELAEAQQAYTEAKRNLYELIQGYNSSGKNSTDASLIMIANQKVHDAECVITKISKMPIDIIEIDDLIGKDLNINNPYDKTLIPDPVISGVYTTFHWKYFWMDKPPEKIPELIPEEEQQGGGEKKKEKTEEEKQRARKWAIINARKRNSFK